MRKSNSEFKASFVSEAGGDLANNDYFAYVELDDFACYVLASGITDFRSTEAAKLAVEHLLLNFEDKPTLSEGTLARYLADTNARLLNNAKAPERLKASVMAIVTDYEKVRYLAAGNIRFRMYRQGRLLLKSADMSLAKDLIDRHESDTVLDKHAERHNLYAYLGKADGFRPYISPKLPLQDGDILTIYTGGFWEHIDEGEIDEIYREASNEPRESLDALEDLLLSRQPAELKSYTAAAVFVNKYYRDPERERKRARYIKIAIITIIVVLILSLIGYLIYRYHEHKVEDLSRTETETVEYMKADNYVRAKESCQSAIDQAKSLRYFEDEKRMRRYLVVIDGINNGDEAFKSKDYQSAFNIYMNTLDNAKDAENLGSNYITDRLAQTEEHLYVMDFLALGNKALAAGDIDKAEVVFYKARDKAASIHDSEGRKAAMEALESLYDQKAKAKEEGEQKAKEAGAAAVADAMSKGDQLLAQGDVEGAEKAYLEARTVANASGDKSSRSEAMKSLEQVHLAKAEKAAEESKTVDEKNRLYAVAADAVNRGDKAFAEGDYVSAQVYYQSALEKFTSLEEGAMAMQAQAKLDQTLKKQGETASAKEDAQKTEDKARALYAARDYPGAKDTALKAKELYTKLGNQTKADEMAVLVQQIEMDAVIDKNLK